MADAQEISGFFHSKNGDRKYKASFFAEYFASFIENGVFIGGSYLKAEPNTGMTIKVLPGKAWINGYYYRLRDAPKIIELEPAHPTLSRIDRLVLSLNVLDNKRNITAVIKKGIEASKPIAPELERNETISELCSAEISINPGMTEIRISNIKDTRLEDSKCGIVTSIFEKPDLTLIFNQYTDFLEQKIIEWESMQANKQADWDEKERLWLEQTEKQQTDWLFQLSEQKKNYDLWKEQIEAWKNLTMSELSQAITFSFDNQFALPGTVKQTIGNVKTGINTVLKMKEIDKVLAEQDTVFTKEKGRIKTIESIQKVYNPDGSIFRHVKATTTKGDIIETEVVNV